MFVAGGLMWLNLHDGSSLSVRSSSTGKNLVWYRFRYAGWPVVREGVLPFAWDESTAEQRKHGWNVLTSMSREELESCYPITRSWSEIRRIKGWSWLDFTSMPGVAWSINTLSAVALLAFTVIVSEYLIRRQGVSNKAIF